MSLHSHLVRGSFAALFAAMLVSCGGGGVVPSTGVVTRPLPADYTSRKAVAYSPFRTANRDTETITSTEILQDLTLLQAGNFRLIRMYDSSDAVAKLTLQTIRSNGLDFKVHLGVNLDTKDSDNQAEIARAIALATSYPDLVEVVSVGNETMVDWSSIALPPAQVAGYLAQVRNGITQPVTTDDNWAFYAAAPASILQAIDFVALHTYPLSDTVSDPTSWNWEQVNVDPADRAVAMMDASLVKAQQDYTSARSYLDRAGYTFLPIVIGETGWKAIASGGEIYRAHPVNQKMYYDRLSTWLASGTGPKNIFWFEAFDEPWKLGDDNWGLFNVSRQARYVIQDLYPVTQWEPGTYTASDAVYYLPTVANPPITANQYTLYAETVTPGEARPISPLIWNAWQNGTTSVASETTTTAAEGTKSMMITPTPLSWGWGMTMAYTVSADDLSAFASSGYLNFSIKTTYPGKIEVGFLTGTASNASLYDVYIPIQSGLYGYVNDGAWHNVKIPISAIIPYGAMSSGMTNPATSKLDMTTVTNPFVIDDRYANTGKAPGSGITTPIYVDDIYWSK
jgi:exo-beta-1,3-glucanase (GH17 family)